MIKILCLKAICATNYIKEMQTCDVEMQYSTLVNFKICVFG